MRAWVGRRRPDFPAHQGDPRCTEIARIDYIGTTAPDVTAEVSSSSIRRRQQFDPPAKLPRPEQAGVEHRAARGGVHKGPR